MSFDLVLFGGTGDLAWRKLMPSLFQAFRHGKLPPGGRILAVARDERTHDLSDAVFVPGLTDFGSPISPFKSDHMTIGKVGGTQIHLKQDKTQIGTDDPAQLDVAVLGLPLRTFLNNLLLILNSLTLPVSGATAGPPTPGTFPTLPTILSGSVEIKK